MSQEKRACVLKKLRECTKNTDITQNKLINIEKSIFNASIKHSRNRGISPSWECKDFRDVYLTKAKGVIGNFRTNPEDYSGRIARGDIDSRDVAFLKPSDIAPSRLKSREIIVCDTKELPDGLYECEKCQQSKTTWNMIQLRDTSESMTTFITCLLCGSRWRL